MAAHLHRVRFLKFQPAGITHIAVTPDSFKNPHVAVVRANGSVELYVPSLIPECTDITETLRNISKSSDIKHRIKEGGNWVLMTTIAGSPDETVEAIQFMLPLSSGSTVPRLFCALSTGWLVEYDLTTLQIKQKVDASYGSSIWCMTSFLDRYLCVGCDDSAVRLFDVSGRQQDASSESESESDDEDSDKSGHYDFAAIQLVRTFERQGDRVVSLCFTGEHVCAGSSDGRVRFWDWQTGRCVGRFNVGSLIVPKVAVKSRQSNQDPDAQSQQSEQTELFVWSIVKLGDTGFLATGDSLGSVKIWDLKSRTLVQSLKTHGADVVTLCANHDGTAIFASGIDSKICLIVRKEDHDRRWFIKQARRPHTHDVRALAWIQLFSDQLSSAPAAGKRSRFDGEQSSVEKGRHVYNIMLSGGVDTMLLVHSNPVGEFSNTSFQPVRIGHQQLFHDCIQTAFSPECKKGILLAHMDHQLHLYGLGVPNVKNQEEYGPLNLQDRPMFLAELNVGKYSSGDGLSGSVKHNIVSSCISQDGSLIFASDNFGRLHLFSLRYNPDDGSLSSLDRLDMPADISSNCLKSAFTSKSNLLLAMSDYSVIMLTVDRDNASVTISNSWNLRVTLKQISKQTDGRSSPITTLETARCGRFALIADMNNRMYLLRSAEGGSFSLEPIPRLTDCKHTAVTFARLPQTANNEDIATDCLVFTATQSQMASPASSAISSDTVTSFHVYDIEARKFVTAYTECFNAINCLRTRRQRVLGVDINTNSSNEITINLVGATWYARVDMSKGMKLLAELKSTSPDLDSTNQDILTTIQDCCTVYTRYDNPLYAKRLYDGDQLVGEVIVERPIKEMMQSLPPAFKYKKFGN